MSSFIAKLRAWLEDRYPLAALLGWAKKKTVPAGPSMLWAYFGGVTLFLFLVQLTTGMLLMLHYKGTADTAFESVRFITTKVPFGWLIRSIHAWAGDLMILAAVIHMFSVFFQRAYEKPRELTWLTGMALLFVLLAFGFSGYLLPWNELSFFATKVGTNMIRVLPWVGEHWVEILRGGPEVSGATLQRFYAAHVVALPLSLILLMGLHLLFIQLQGMHEPSAWKTAPEKRKLLPFFPHFVLRELFLFCVLLNVLAMLAFFLPAELGTQADAFAPAPEGIRPEWYFMWAYQLLKFLPAHLGPWEGETVGIFFMGGAGVLWTLVPWLDRSSRAPLRKIVRGLGVLLLLAMILFTVLGYVLP